MRGLRIRLGLLAILCSCLALPVSLSAFTPSVLMFYGGPLSRPVHLVVRTSDEMDYNGVFWGASGRPVEPEMMGERPYIQMAFFYGIKVETLTDAALAALKPEDANQHGRLYLPRGTVRASAVSTAYAKANMVQGVPTGVAVQPLPTGAAAFKWGNWLADGDLDPLRAAGIPLDVLPHLPRR